MDNNKNELDLLDNKQYRRSPSENKLYQLIFYNLKQWKFVSVSTVSGESSKIIDKLAMKKVCVNRLKADVDKLQYFVNSLEHQEDTLEALFQCILRLFENEMAQGNPCSVHGHMNATNGLLNSQSSIFNSKHNISALNLDSVGMSFGKATDDGHLNKGHQKHQVLGQSSGAALIKNMNRQYNSDRNIFRQASNNAKIDDPTSSNTRNNLYQQDAMTAQQLQYQQEIESEVVHMGELLRDSNDKNELKKRMTVNQELDDESSPCFTGNMMRQSSNDNNSPNAQQANPAKSMAALFVSSDQQITLGTNFQNNNIQQQKNNHKKLSQQFVVAAVAPQHPPTTSMTSKTSQPQPQQQLQPFWQQSSSLVDSSSVSGMGHHNPAGDGSSYYHHGRNRSSGDNNNAAIQETPHMKNEHQVNLQHQNRHHQTQHQHQNVNQSQQWQQRQFQLHNSHSSALQQTAAMAYGLGVDSSPAGSPQNININNLPVQQQIQQKQKYIEQQMLLKESHDSISTSKLLGGGVSHFSHQVQFSSWQHMPQSSAIYNQRMRGQNVPNNNTSGMGNMNQREFANGRSFKEVIKVFVTMMVEDIWAHYEGFSWQKRLMLQSEEKKKKKRQFQQDAVALQQQQQQKQKHKTKKANKKASNHKNSKQVPHPQHSGMLKAMTDMSKWQTNSGPQVAQRQNSNHRTQQHQNDGQHRNNLASIAGGQRINPLCDDSQSASSFGDDIDEDQDVTEFESSHRSQQHLEKLNAAQPILSDDGGLLAVNTISLLESGGRRAEIPATSANEIYILKTGSRSSPRNKSAIRVSFCHTASASQQQRHHEYSQHEYQHQNGSRNQRGHLQNNHHENNHRHQNQLPPAKSSVPASPQQERRKTARVTQSYRLLDGPSSLNVSKKSSSVSNYKMDFIDPSKKQKKGTNANAAPMLSRFVELPPTSNSGTKKKIHGSEKRRGKGGAKMSQQANSSAVALQTSKQNSKSNNCTAAVKNRKLTLDQIQARERSQVFMNPSSTSAAATARNHNNNTNTNMNMMINLLDHQAVHHHPKHHNQLLQQTNNKNGGQQPQPQPQPMSTASGGFETSKSEENLITHHIVQQNQHHNFTTTATMNADNNVAKMQQMPLLLGPPYFEMGQGHNNNINNAGMVGTTATGQQSCHHNHTQQTMNTIMSDDDRNSFVNLTVRTQNSRQQEQDSSVMVGGSGCAGATIPTATSAAAPSSLHPNTLFKQKSSNDAVKMRYMMGSRNHDYQRLTLTTNSLVSPADLEAASDYEFEQHYKTISSGRPINDLVENIALAVNCQDPVGSGKPETKSSSLHKPQQSQGHVTKPAFLAAGHSSSKHSSPKQHKLSNECISATGVNQLRTSQESWAVSNQT